ncbi:MAG TPA: zinc ribbon domain-containing protein [Terrimesophilobacter sp.]|nr:zinc ribbon domain-containing protein [Terrimesophilobacter sp.]
MERCDSCGRELASTWKFCIYCGRPMHRAVPAPAFATAPTTPASIPSAIRPDFGFEPAKKYDAPFWVGVGMGALGLVLIVYAAVQIYASYA